ncbi:MAG: flagellar filament capping protein FliD [Deltaproteobacteria bacterium]|nr:flagellar filament capping protein FliD [Deltaproteobacteria bacterium]
MSGVGLASGINTDQLITQLLAIERRPITRIESKIKSRQNQLAFYQDLRSRLDTLRSAVSSIKSLTSFSSIEATTSDDDLVGISATGTAQTGSHTIKVAQLATNEITVSQGFDSNFAEIGTGTFRITVGGEDHDIEVNATNNTLQGLRDAINGLDAGVTASIINDGGASPYRLVVSADETGTENAHSVSLVGWSGQTVDFTDGAGGTPGQAAQNALFTFDGISVTKSTNEVDDLLDGVTLFLKDDSEPNTVVNLKLSSNVSKVKENIQKFVDAYNDVRTYLKDKLATSDMRGDFTFSQIQSELGNIVAAGTPNADGLYTTLSQIGVTHQSGKLTINDTALTDALEDHFDDVIALFASKGNTSNQYVSYVSATANTSSGSYAVDITGTGASFGGTIGGYAANVYSGNYLIGAEGTPVEGLMIKFTGTSAGDYGTVDYSVGLMEQFERRLNGYLNGSTSLLSEKENRINSVIDDFRDQVEAKERRLEKTEAQLRAKFTRMEQVVQQLQVSQGALTALGNTRLFY